jgi:hypothetical protein
MFLEADEVAVPIDLWVRVLRGDEAAGREIEKMLEGVVLYCHVLTLGDDANDYAVMALRELHRHRVVPRVRFGV